MKCECACLEKAYAKVTWSTTMPPQTANLCEKHVMELWETLNPLVKMNLACVVFDPLTFRLEGGCQ